MSYILFCFWNTGKRSVFFMPTSFFPPDIHPLPTAWPLQILRICLLFFTGGVLYFLIEILWRGYSHISMFFCGGFCFVGIYLINRICRLSGCFIRWVLGAIFITISEFWCGVAVNLFLQLNVWDYSGLPLNLLGQVCLPFTMIWFLLCIPADCLCLLFRRLFRVEFSQKYWSITNKAPFCHSKTGLCGGQFGVYFFFL